MLLRTMTQVFSARTPHNSLIAFKTGDVSVAELTGLKYNASTGINQGFTPPKTTPLKPEDEITFYNDWAPWGDSDDFPQRLIQKLDYLGVVKSAIDVNAAMHYGSGLCWFTDEYTEDGKIVRKPVKVPGWKEWCRNTNYDLVHGEMIESLETFYNAFPVISMDGDKVGSVYLLDTPRCRLAKRNEQGRIEKLFYNVDPGVSTAKIKTLPIFDPRYPKKYAQFVYPIQYRTFGKLYYGEPNYYATFRAGWADVSIQVAKFMKSVYTNMMTLKYHLKIPLSTMRAKYSEWDVKEEAEKLQLLLEFKTEIDNHLTMPENAGKTIFSVYDDMTQGETVTIEPIKNFLDSSKELPSNIAGNSEMLFALGTDPAMVGLNNPGGKDLNGSGGSDKRESRKSKQANLKLERTVSLQLTNLIAYLNGYDAEIYPAYLDVDTSQTMDENPTGKKTTTA